jgi:UDP-galactopyranose mutase
VHIADDVPDFVAAAEAALREGKSSDWLRRVDAFLSQDSWDRTWLRMMKLMDSAVAARMATDPLLNETSGANISNQNRPVA